MDNLHFRFVRTKCDSNNKRNYSLFLSMNIIAQYKTFNMAMDKQFY